jgi:hypothetical protein
MLLVEREQVVLDMHLREAIAQAVLYFIHYQFGVAVSHPPAAHP